MAREKEPKIIISKEAALQITTKDECVKLLNEVRNARRRAENIITRRRAENERLTHIETNLAQRLEFLSIMGVVEPDTWYEQKGIHSNKDRCYVVSSNRDSNSMHGWQFSIGENLIRRSWHNNDYVFIHPLNDTIIVEPPRNEREEVMVEESIEVSHHTYYLKGDQSFLLNWTPSSDLSQAIQKPSILEVKGIIDDMWAHNKGRRLKKMDHNDGGTGKDQLRFVKHNKEWYLLLNIE